MSLLKNNLTPEELEQLHQVNLSDRLYEKILAAGYGAHNQKSEIQITVDVNINNKIWIEDLVDISKKASSCATFSVLKRGDEKYVTESSYMGKYINSKGQMISTQQNDGPKFVEDIARDCAYYLNSYLDNQINDYLIVVNNEESIHSQDIYATAVKTAGRQLI
jgi:GTP cyclohydrolase I